MKTFNLTPSVTIVCDSKKTRNGFRHEAVLLLNGISVDRTKINYLNRTWESFEFQSVMEKLVDRTKDIPKDKKPALLAMLRKDPSRSNPLAVVGFVAALGDILCASPDEVNDWKLRMLKAGMPDLDPPSDWATLPEEEKKRRLDGIIKIARENA